MAASGGLSFRPRERGAEIIIVGGGIAGAGAAYEMSAFASVILLEAEQMCGFHATGRSAASFSENYGTGIIRRLALGSRGFLEVPPDEFSTHPLLKPCGMLTIARADQQELLNHELAHARQLVPSIERVGAEDALRLVPPLRRDYVADAILEPNSASIDVDALQQGFLRQARKRGAAVETGQRVRAIEFLAGKWHVHTQKASFSGDLIVNAAGAWADEVAELAGLEPIGLVPKRRSAFNIPAPAGIDISGWPLVNDVGEEFYFKPDAGKIFASPSDATPSAPMDAYANDLDIAIAIDRLERATTIRVDRVPRTWAGLRTFAPDGSPVVGADTENDRFIWLAGQGGYGIKTSPALSRICANLILHEAIPGDLGALGLDADSLSPRRFRKQAREKIGGELHEHRAL